MISRLAKLLGIVSALLIAEPALANEALIYDANGNVQSRALPGGTTQYGYDDLDRLTSEAGPAKSQSLTYDANDNRLSDGTGSKTYTANTNKLATANGQTVTLDQVGKITLLRGLSLDWNQAGQLKTVKQGSTLLATYYYDYRGRRSRKVTPTETTIYLYDLWDHLLGEFNGTGAPLRTYIWKDDTPVAVILHGTPEKVLYLETDHLNTPIAARDENAKLVWKWESDAFGSTLPNEDPDGDGQKTTVNLRFPGQFYDKESGFHYNHHRYYDPQSGRYLSSDPIGLTGGRNSFGYVGGNPMSFVDPEGLDRWGGDTAFNWSTKSGVPLPRDAELYAFTMCMRSCYGDPFTLTSTHEPYTKHGPGTAHGDGRAIDLRHRELKDPKKALCCAKKCGARYGLDEGKNPSGHSSAPHFHLELSHDRNRNWSGGDLPKKNQCEPCDNPW